jgi:hypothetical protein
MPISIGASLPPPFTPPATRQFDYTYVEWVQPDAVTRWPLTFPPRGYFLTDGVAGLGSVPLTFTIDPLPGGGSRVRAAPRAESRIMTIPIVVAGNTPEQYQQLDDQLEDAFTRTSEEGPGMLRFVRADGTERRILAYYQGGWDSGGGDDWLYNIVPVQLFCPDGYFSDPNETVIEASYSAGGTSFLNRYPRTSRTRVLGVTQLTNRGTVKAWPRWRIDGPYTSFEAVQLNPDGSDSDVKFTLNAPIDVGEARLIDTTPGVTTVTDADGNPALGDLTLPGSSLFGLPRGVSGVRFTAAGAGSGTRVTLRFFPRFKKA